MIDKSIYLTVEDQEYLRNIIKSGILNLHKITRAKVCCPYWIEAMRWVVYGITE